MLISLSLLLFYVRFPLSPEYKEFFSGALAFQFIIGCLLVVLVRHYEYILRQTGLAPIVLVKIGIMPIQQIAVISKSRRDARRAAGIPFCVFRWALAFAGIVEAVFSKIKKEFSSWWNRNPK